MRKTTTIIFITILLVCAILQAGTGSFPAAFFAFPVNLIFCLLWVAVMLYTYAEKKSSRIVSAMMSSYATIWSLALLVAGSLVIGLFPQLQAGDAAGISGIAGRLGAYDFMSSWIFAGIIMLFLTNLGYVTIRRVRSTRTRRWRFLLNHAGVWIAVAAGFVGSADEQVLRMAVDREHAENIAYDMSGKSVFIRERLVLKDFEVSLDEDGSARQYRALLTDLSEDGCDNIDVEVNKPFRLGFGRDLYLTGYDQTDETPQYCILQIVVQPYRYAILAGIIMTLAGAVLLFAGGAGKNTSKA